MTIREFYEQTAGDYEGVMGRLMTEQRVQKYVLKFPNGTDFADLTAALEAGQWDLAFRAVHNLKGMSLNLGFAPMAAVSSDLCELLRDGQPKEDPAPYYEKVRTAYEGLTAAIAGLDR